MLYARASSPPWYPILLAEITRCCSEPTIVHSVKRDSPFQLRLKYIAPLATRGLEFVRGMKTECVRDKEIESEAAAIVKLLDSAVIPCGRMTFI